MKSLESKLNVRVNDLESKLAMIENGDEEEKESSEEEVDSEIQVEELSNNDKCKSKIQAKRYNKIF